MQLRQKTTTLSPLLEILKNRRDSLKLTIKNQDIKGLREAVKAYQSIGSQITSPLDTIEPIGHILNGDDLRLQDYRWQSDNSIHLSLEFLEKSPSLTGLATQVETLLTKTRKTFSGCAVELLKAPYDSGPQDLFKSPVPEVPPLIHIRILCP